MAFKKSIDLPDGGTAEYHRIASLRIAPGEVCGIEIGSYRDEAARRAGKQPCINAGPSNIAGWHSMMGLSAEQIETLKPEIDALLGKIYTLLNEQHEQFDEAEKA